MTVRQFLSSTGLSFAVIATACDAHVSQVYRWADGSSFPSGRHLAGLLKVSAGAIDLAAEAPRRRRKQAA
jgi:hypothetical protein